MLHAEDRLELKLQKFRGKNKKHHWSLWMVGKQVQLELVKKIVQRAKAKSQRKKVTKLIEKLKKNRAHNRTRRIFTTGTHNHRHQPKIENIYNKIEKFLTRYASEIRRKSKKESKNEY